VVERVGPVAGLVGDLPALPLEVLLAEQVLFEVGVGPHLHARDGREVLEGVEPHPALRADYGARLLVQIPRPTRPDRQHGVVLERDEGEPHVLHVVTALLDSPGVATVSLESVGNRLESHPAHALDGRRFDGRFDGRLIDAR